MYRKIQKTKSQNGVLKPLPQVAEQSSLRGRNATRYTLHGAGFTLVETLVAIFVVMIAVVAPMSIASQALSSARYAKDEVTAFYLAQDGIELVRNIRDNNVIAGGIWNEGYLGASAPGSETRCYQSSGCKIEAKDLSVSDCVGGCPIFYIDQNGIYTYITYNASATMFTRTIKIKKVSDTEIKVTSEVSWPTAKAPFVITDNLKNWP